MVAKVDEPGHHERCVTCSFLTKEVSIKKYRAELAIMMSCSKRFYIVKANHTLDDYSARDLIYQPSQCDNPLITALMAVRSLVNFTKSDMKDV